MRGIAIGAVCTWGGAGVMEARVLLSGPVAFGETEGPGLGEPATASACDTGGGAGGADGMPALVGCGGGGGGGALAARICAEGGGGGGGGAALAART